MTFAGLLLVAVFLDHGLCQIAKAIIAVEKLRQEQRAKETESHL